MNLVTDPIILLESCLKASRPCEWKGGRLRASEVTAPDSIQAVRSKTVYHRAQRGELSRFRASAEFCPPLDHHCGGAVQPCLASVKLSSGPPSPHRGTLMAEGREGLTPPRTTHARDGRPRPRIWPASPSPHVKRDRLCKWSRDLSIQEVMSEPL